MIVRTYGEVGLRKPASGAEAAERFSGAPFIMRRSALEPALLVKGTCGSVRKRRVSSRRSCRRKARLWPLRRLECPAPAGRRERRLALMERQRLDKQPVVAARNFTRQTAMCPERRDPAPDAIRATRRATKQMTLHAPRPWSSLSNSTSALQLGAGDGRCKAHAPHPPSANSIASGRASLSRTPPQALPHADRLRR